MIPYIKECKEIRKIEYEAIRDVPYSCVELSDWNYRLDNAFELLNRFKYILCKVLNEEETTVETLQKSVIEIWIYLNSAMCIIEDVGEGMERREIIIETENQKKQKENQHENQ